MMLNKTYVELGENREPLVTDFDEFTSKTLKYLLILLFYLAPLSIGLFFEDYFTQSPIVKVFALFFGSIASIITFLIALLSVGLLTGNTVFAKDVFMLYRNYHFSIAISLVFLLLPIARFLTGTIQRTASYEFKKWIFILAFLLLLAALSLFLYFINTSENSHIYLFNCFVIGVFYWIAFNKNYNKRKMRKRPRFNYDSPDLYEE